VINVFLDIAGIYSDLNSKSNYEKQSYASAEIKLSNDTILIFKEME